MDSSHEILGAKVRKALIVLFKDIAAQRGRKIAADLEELGAFAVFIPYQNEASYREHTPLTESSSSVRFNK